jgi:hypothetical protein
VTPKLPPKYANIPAQQLYSLELTDSLFRTLAQIHGLAWKTKGDYTPVITVLALAELRGLQERRMYDHLTELKKMRYIRIKNCGHNKIIIYPLCWDKGTALPAETQSRKSPTDEVIPLCWDEGTALPAETHQSGLPKNGDEMQCDIDFTAKNCSKNGDSSCCSCFKNNESVFKEKQQQLPIMAMATAINCSGIPSDMAIVVDMLVNRCGCPTDAAIRAVQAATERNYGPIYLQYDILRWLAYCQSPHGKSIGAPGIFIASKIKKDESCPLFFETSANDDLHCEIQELWSELQAKSEADSQSD